MGDFFFAGGYFYPTLKRPDGHGGFLRFPDTTKPRTFALVRPSDSRLPYVTHDSDGLRLTSHHANLYQLNSDGKTARLVRYRYRGAAMFENGTESLVANVSLTDEQAADLKAAIERNVFYDEV